MPRQQNGFSKNDNIENDVGKSISNGVKYKEEESGKTTGTNNIFCLRSSTSLHAIADISISIAPYITFLTLFLCNRQLGILANFEDIVDSSRLYNVSYVEETLVSLWSLSGDGITKQDRHRKPVISFYSSSEGSTCLDILSALPYLLHYALPVVYPIYLYVKGHVDDIGRFYWLLGWVMWSHYVIWYVMPTAPPWLHATNSNNDNKASGVDSTSNANNGDIINGQNSKEPIRTLLTTADVNHLISLRFQHKEGCAFSRLDALIAYPFFYRMFNENPVPFASFPSGHVAWPMCIYAVRPPGGRLFILYLGWVIWATLYSCHHYALDAMGAVFLVVAVKRLLSCLSAGRSSCRRTRGGLVAACELLDVVVCTNLRLV